VRHLADEWAFVHKIGLRLAQSEARESADGWVHELHFDLFRPQRKMPIKGEILPFLRLLQPGAEILISTADADRLPVSQWGAGLAKIGGAVSAAEVLSKALDLDFNDFRLVDLADEEFGNSLGFLDHFLLRSARLESTVPTFVLGSMAELSEEEIPKRNVRLRVPLVTNWKETGIVLWVKCQGVAFMDGARCCGIQISKQEEWHLEKMKRFTKSIYPEVWIDKAWPAVRLDGKDPGIYEWADGEQSDITLEAGMTLVG
jgi:hypothetical protein